MINLTPETKAMLLKRFKSLCWTVGTFAALAALNFVSANIMLVGLPMWEVAIISLVLNQITKVLNSAPANSEEISPSSSVGE